VATRLQPNGELLVLARQVDDHGLMVWREAAGSLVDDCPPSLLHLRWGWRKSNAPSCAATPTSCDAKPSSVLLCVARD
jgi:hypothetical protein